uniref:hypothetical protein n=1 Tax=Photorhabdus sp. RM96S TaxID=3342822 RepID=UPI0036DB685B
ALQGFGLGLLLGAFVLTGSWLGLYRPLQQQLTALTDTCLSYTNILTCPLVIELFPHRLISITNTT